MDYYPCIPFPLSPSGCNCLRTCSPVIYKDLESGWSTDLESRPPTTPRLIASCHMQWVRVKHSKLHM